MRPLGVFLLLAIAITPRAAAGQAPAPGWLGFGFTYHHDPLKKTGWLHVQHVVPNGPAHRAGLRPQDVITAIDGHPIAFADDAKALQFFAGVRAGRELRLSVVRQQKTIALSVKAIPRPNAAAREWDQNRELAKQRRSQH
jgi:S1-C subfamily serine protease